MPSPTKKSTRPTGKKAPTAPPAHTLDLLNDLLRASHAREYREALLEIFHAYVIHEHEALPVDFTSIAQRIHLLSEFLKALDLYNPESGERRKEI